VKQAPEWSFNVRPPQLAFLLLMGDGGFELGRASPPDSPTPGAAAPPSPEQLTHTQGRVAEFGVSHDGEQIAFTVKNAQDGADLWLMNRDGGQARGLVDCGRDTCSAPAWAPDGARLAYVRTPAAATGQTTNLGRVWTVQPASGQTVPLYQDPQVTGSEPAWSPDGRWLGFFDSHAGGLHLLDVQTSDSFILPSVMGQMGSWSPDSTHLAFADLALGGAQLATRLQMADIQNQSIQLVVDTDRGWLDFGPPAWSPAGDWIALSLRSAVTGGPGKQIWLMHPDGSAAHPVLADAAYGFGGYHWDPWGDRLVFQRYAVNDPQAQPEIMLWSPSAPDAAPVSVARSAALAAWLP
jgi:Tol biopolymer transport system component